MSELMLSDVETKKTHVVVNGGNTFVFAFSSDHTLLAYCNYTTGTCTYNILSGKTVHLSLEAFKFLLFYDYLEDKVLICVSEGIQWLTLDGKLLLQFDTAEVPDRCSVLSDGILEVIAENDHYILSPRVPTSPFGTWDTFMVPFTPVHQRSEGDLSLPIICTNMIRIISNKDNPWLELGLIFKRKKQGNTFEKVDSNQLNAIFEPLFTTIKEWIKAKTNFSNFLEKVVQQVEELKKKVISAKDLGLEEWKEDK